MKTKTNKLWLRSTSRYPDCEAFILCRTARESVERSLTQGEVLHPIIVKLTNSCHAYCGRGAWNEWEHTDKPRKFKGRRFTNFFWRRILVRVGPPERFPRKVCYHTFKDMPEFEFKTYREAIIGVTAHEMGHALGYSGRKEGEEKCEMLAWDALDYYRKHQAEIDAEIDAALRAQRPQKPTVEDKAAEKLAKAEASLKKWKRKLALATNKVKRYTRMVRRLSKAPEPMVSFVGPAVEHEAEPERLAATDDWTDK